MHVVIEEFMHYLLSLDGSIESVTALTLLLLSAILYVVTAEDV